MTDIHRAPPPLAPVPAPDLSLLVGQGVPVAQPSRQSKRKNRELKRMKIEPQPEGQLEQLLISNKAAKDKAEVANEEEAEYKAAIKSWLLSLFASNPQDLPDAFDIAGDPLGRYPAYTMTLKTGTRVDTEAMKQDGSYERYAKPTAPSWELRPTQQGRR